MAGDQETSVTGFQKMYKALGFSKRYNFWLWFVFAGAMMGFVLSRFQYFDINGVFCGPVLSPTSHSAPGECYYYENFDREKIGIRLHLFAVLPAGFLVCFQFTPFFRYKSILFHRINGYVVILLVLIGNVGGIMIGRHAFGGTLATQSYVGSLAIMTTGGLFLAWYNIKKLQIDQHRAWMLRTWFYLSTIITLRLINTSGSIIIGMIGDYYAIQPCAKLASIFGYENDPVVALYPECAAYASGENPNAFAIVHADMTSGNPAEISAAFDLVFGMAAWLALLIHAVGVEVYLYLTPRESERLRKVSYQRQLEAGFSNPGSSGFTAQRFGDADPYVPFDDDKDTNETTGLLRADRQSKNNLRTNGYAIGSDSSSS